MYPYVVDEGVLCNHFGFLNGNLILVTTKPPPTRFLMRIPKRQALNTHTGLRCGNDML